MTQRNRITPVARLGMIGSRAVGPAMRNGVGHARQNGFVRAVAVKIDHPARPLMKKPMLILWK